MENTILWATPRKEKGKQYITLSDTDSKMYQSERLATTARVKGKVAMSLIDYNYKR